MRLFFIAPPDSTKKGWVRIRYRLIVIANPSLCAGPVNSRRSSYPNVLITVGEIHPETHQHKVKDVLHAWSPHLWREYTRGCNGPLNLGGELGFQIGSV